MVATLKLSEHLYKNHAQIKAQALAVPDSPSRSYHGSQGSPTRSDVNGSQTSRSKASIGDGGGAGSPDRGASASAAVRVRRVVTFGSFGWVALPGIVVVSMSRFPKSSILLSIFLFIRSTVF